MTSLVKPFGIIADWHKDGDHTYSFDDEGMQVYRIFADEMAQIMNIQWESGDINQGNVSKDKRTMIRSGELAYIIYILITERIKSWQLLINFV